ncbi:MAG: tyrosine-type recombinase/integrase [Mycobacteriales bacterium]
MGVSVYPVRQRPDSAAPYQVRWQVNGRHASKQFRRKAAAVRFHAELTLAADNGDRFDPRTKLPVEAGRLAGDRTVYEAMVGYVTAKWPRWAPTSRSSVVEVLAVAASLLVDTLPPVPDRAAQQDFLRRVALIPGPGHSEPDFREEADRRADRCLARHSLPLSTVDGAVIDTVLTAFAFRLDTGNPVKPSVLNRRRSVLGGFFRHTVRRGWLATDPMTQSDWTRPPSSAHLGSALLPTAPQARTLLDAIRTTGRAGAGLAPFFATLYYAGLRPSEARGLRPEDLDLPAEGWGQIIVRGGLTSTARRYTDDGARVAQRGLKWRSSTATRHVPIPPDLVVILREHLVRHPAPAGALVFTNLRGGPLDSARYLRVFHAAANAVFPNSSPLTRLTPYDLRHANATLMLNAGVPLPEAARRLGHSPEVLLSIYAGVTDSDLHTANDRIQQALDPTARGTRSTP